MVICLVVTRLRWLVKGLVGQIGKYAGRASHSRGNRGRRGRTRSRKKSRWVASSLPELVVDPGVTPVTPAQSTPEPPKPWSLENPDPFWRQAARSLFYGPGRQPAGTRAKETVWGLSFERSNPNNVYDFGSFLVESGYDGMAAVRSIFVTLVEGVVGLFKWVGDLIW